MELADDNKNKLEMRRKAQQILSIWDLRHTQFAMAKIPNDETLWNILTFLWLKDSHTEVAKLSEIEDKFKTPDHILLRYARILVEANLIKVQVIENDHLLTIAEEGETLIQQIFDKAEV